MPKYQIEFDAEPATAKAVNDLLIDQVTNFAMRTVEVSPPLGKAGKDATGRRTRVNGQSASLLIFNLAKSLDGGPVSRTRIKQMLLREKYHPNTVHASVSKLAMAGVADVYDDKSVKLKNKTMTVEKAAELIREYEKSHHKS